jgi:CheY-like chemotaxis protein
METSKGNILVVDDDLLNRIKLSTNLEEAGYAVTLATNGAEALEKLRLRLFTLSCSIF